MFGANRFPVPPVVEDQLPESDSMTMTELVSGLVEDAEKLLQQQIEMFKAEFQEDLRRTRQATELGGVGIVLMTIGGLTLVAFLVNGLHEQFGYSMTASCLIIGGVLLALGLLFGVLARSLFSTFNPLPSKSLTALWENLTWKTHGGT